MNVGNYNENKADFLEWCYFSNAMGFKTRVDLDEVDSVISVFTKKTQCAGKFYRFRHQTINGPAPIPFFFFFEKSAVLALLAVFFPSSCNCLRGRDRY